MAQVNHGASAQPLSELAASLTALAASIQERRPAPVLMELLATTQRVCTRAADEERSTELKQLLSGNVGTALQTWRDVWPRLGSQAEFRTAVAREARLWATRLSVNQR